MSTAAEALTLLRNWRAESWLRALDLALAEFLHGLAPDAPPSLLMAAAWLAQLEGRGHSCLPLDGLAQEAPALLAWPPEAQGAAPRVHPLSCLLALRDTFHYSFCDLGTLAPVVIRGMGSIGSSRSSYHFWVTHFFG
jgi:hypothetical protein